MLTNQYLIEMITNDLRWSLKLHHIVDIITTTYFMWILDDYADLAALRWYMLFVIFCCMLYVVSLYSFKYFSKKKTKMNYNK